MKSLSAKTYPDAGIETLAATTETPFDIVAAREELLNGLMAQWNRPLTVPVNRFTQAEDIVKAGSLVELVSADPVMGFMATEMAAFAERRRLADAKWIQKTTLRSNFGRWLQEDEKRIVSTAKDGLESIEDRLSVLPYVMEKIRSRKAWKAEQNLAQDPANYADESLHYDLPPRTKGKSHVPAFYSITGPSGRTIDLSQPHGAFAPIKSNNPNDAFRRFLTRMGVERKGGEVEILNLLLKADKVTFTNPQGEVSSDYRYLPSYVSELVDSEWRVIVGWRLNPKVTPSRFWVDANAELTEENPNRFQEADGSWVELTPDVESYQAPLTLSQMDYHLLCESSSLAVENEDGEVVEFMNEDEEFLTCFPQREENETFIDESKYAEDDDELELFRACSAVIERSEGGITLGDLESSQFVDGYLHKGILKMERVLRDIIEQPMTLELLRTIESMEAHLTRLNKLDAMWNHFVGNGKTDHLVTYWYPNNRNRMMSMSSERHARMIPEVIQGASVIPDNAVSEPVMLESDVMPESKAVQFSWLTALSAKLDAKRQLEARKGQVLRSIESGTLAVELAFNATFDRMLGLRS